MFMAHGRKVERLNRVWSWNELKVHFRRFSRGLSILSLVNWTCVAILLRSSVVVFRKCRFDVGSTIGVNMEYSLDEWIVRLRMYCAAGRHLMQFEQTTNTFQAYINFRAVWCRARRTVEVAERGLTSDAYVTGVTSIWSCLTCRSGLNKILTGIFSKHNKSY